MRTADVARPQRRSKALQRKSSAMVPALRCLRFRRSGGVLEIRSPDGIRLPIRNPLAPPRPRMPGIAVPRKRELELKPQARRAQEVEDLEKQDQGFGGGISGSSEAAGFGGDISWQRSRGSRTRRPYAFHVATHPSRLRQLPSKQQDLESQG